jgi:hypothetical protein
MNRSYSKIRHIQEANQRLEKRFMVEQNEQLSDEDKKRLDDMVNSVVQQGYKVVPKVDLPDGTYGDSGGGYVGQLIQLANPNDQSEDQFLNIRNGKKTGYIYIQTEGLRGMWDRRIDVRGGKLEDFPEGYMGGSIYKVLYKKP